MSETVHDEAAEARLWVRTKTACRIVEIGLTTLYALMDNGSGPVRSRCIKRPGAIRGTRLIYLPSLLAWIESQSSTEPQPAALRGVRKKKDAK